MSFPEALLLGCVLLFVSGSLLLNLLLVHALLRRERPEDNPHGNSVCVHNDTYPLQVEHDKEQDSL